MPTCHLTPNPTHTRTRAHPPRSPPGTVFFDCTDANQVVNGGRGGVNTSIVVGGLNFGFGPSTSVTIDGQECPCDPGSRSHTSLTCTTSLCFGGLVVSAAGQASEPYPYSYRDLVALPEVGSAAGA